MTTHYLKIRLPNSKISKNPVGKLAKKQGCEPPWTGQARYTVSAINTVLCLSDIHCAATRILDFRERCSHMPEQQLERRLDRSLR
jgi:hypothetical protein